MKAFLQPVTVTPPRPDPSQREQSMYVRSYLFMRATVGAIGVALPIVVVLVDGLAFAAEPFFRNSLSAYYYSGARELFVGTLCATAVVLVTYKVFEHNLDNTLSITAGLAALTVALFPTGGAAGVPLTPLQDRLGEGVVQGIHFGAAFVFIVSLGALCYFFGLREGRRPPRPGHRSPEFWRRFHWVCAGLIGAALAFIGIAGLAGGPDQALLIGETVAVWAFGASWLMKGLELDVLLSRPE